MNQDFHLVLISFNAWKQPYPVYPLGVSYLASYLRNHHPWLKVTVLDVNLDSLDKPHFDSLAPDLIGVSLRNIDNVDSLNQQAFVDEYLSLMKQIKACCNAPIIVGGAGFSLYPQELLQAFDLEYGICGEGEAVLSQFICCLREGKEPPAVAGLVRRDQTQPETFVNHRSTSGPIAQVNPGSTEKRHWISQTQLTFEDRLLPYYWENSGMLNIQSKRGCPYSCVYCSYPIIDGKRVRTLPVPQIIDTLKRAFEEEGIDYLFFTDSVFNIAPKYNAELADALIKLDLPIRWGAYFSPYRLTRKQLEHYQAAGLTHIEFGTESLADSTLKAYNKPFDASQVMEVSNACHELGIYYAHFLIIGGLGETQSSLEETLEKAQQLKNTVLFPYFGMRIYPQTRLHQIAIEKGVIDAKDPLLKPSYYIEPGLNYESFKKQALAQEQSWVMRDDDSGKAIEARLRAKGKRGPLWEYLIR